MSASRTAVAVLLAVTYLSTATAALPAVCAASCAADAGPKGTVCHRAARAEAGTSCHRAKPVARCPMHEARDASGRCCAMSGDRQQAEHLLLSLMSAAFPVPEPVDLLQAPNVSRLERAPSPSPFDRWSVPATPPPRG